MYINQNEIRFWYFLLLSLHLPFVAYGDDHDSIPVHELKEVTVEGDRILHKDGHEILMLDSRNRNFGTNALDAVSSLPRFITSLNETKLISWNRSEVFILINGVPSTAMDLRSYKGSDIKKVEYYSSAPSQYMSLSDGPLVNIILKKRHDRLYTGYFNAVNSVTTGFGTDQIDLSYSDSLNQVKAGYILDYRDEKDISIHSEYEYLPSWSSTYENKERYSGQYHSLYGSYQHYRTNHLFNAKLSFVTSPGKETTSGNLSRCEGGDLKYSTNNTLLKSNARSASVDLYYNSVFNNGSVFAIDIVNTLGRSYSQSEISSPANGTLSSIVNGRTYSFVAHTFFSSKVLGWKYTVGSRYEYKELRQEYHGISEKPYSHREFISLGANRSFGRWSFVPSLGLDVLVRSDGVNSNTYTLPYLRMYTDWWPSGKLKGFTTQLTLLSRHLAPNLGMLTESYTYKDYNFLAVGNPELKNYWENTAKLHVCYFVPGRKDQIIFMAQTRYIKDAIASMLKVVDGKAYLKPSNLHHRFDQTLYLYGSWYPLPWLEVSPYMEYYIHRFDASSCVRESYLRYGGTMSATVGKFTLIVAANSPTREFDGDLTSDGSPQYGAIVQYKYRGWSFGAEYHYLGHNNRTYGEADGFSMLECSDWRPLHTMVSLTATYSFSIGRSRRHGKKMIYESSTESGLNQYNTPKKPE